MQDVTFRIEKEPVKITKTEHGCNMMVYGKIFKIGASHVQNLQMQDGESIDGTMSIDVDFRVKTNKKQETRVIRDDSFSTGVAVWDFNGQDISDFTSEPEFYAMNGGLDLFWVSLYDLLDGRIERGDLKNIITREGEDWSDEEEQVACEIYEECKDDYALQLSLIDQCVSSRTLLRSKEAVEMKVNQYKSIDKNSGIEGLKNISKKTRETWERNKTS